MPADGVRGEEIDGAVDEGRAETAGGNGVGHVRGGWYTRSREKSPSDRDPRRGVDEADQGEMISNLKRRSLSVIDDLF
jgi:hypothetical protein